MDRIEDVRAQGWHRDPAKRTLSAGCRTACQPVLPETLGSKRPTLRHPRLTKGRWWSRLVGQRRMPRISIGRTTPPRAQNTTRPEAAEDAMDTVAKSVPWP
jgi:hypothetical protein